MAVSAKIVALAGLSLLLVPAARAQDSKPLPPGAPCEGTLCDWYHSSRPDTAAATTGGATPVTAPSSGPMSWFGRSSGPKNAQPAEEPSSTNGYMSMGGGGFTGGYKGEHCTGTLCDTYYGSSPSAGSQAPAGQRQAAAAAASAEPRVPYRHVVHESETRPKCSSPTADPWRCFR